MGQNDTNMQNTPPAFSGQAPSTNPFSAQNTIPSSATGDIVLEPTTPPKKSKKPLIIFLIVAAIMMGVFTIIAMANNNNNNITSSNASNLTTLANFIDQQKTGLIDYEYSINEYIRGVSLDVLLTDSEEKLLKERQKMLNSLSDEFSNINMVDIDQEAQNLIETIKDKTNQERKMYNNIIDFYNAIKQFCRNESSNVSFSTDDETWNNLQKQLSEAKATNNTTTLGHSTQVVKDIFHSVIENYNSTNNDEHLSALVDRLYNKLLERINS